MFEFHESDFRFFDDNTQKNMGWGIKSWVTSWDEVMVEMLKQDMTLWNRKQHRKINWKKSTKNAVQLQVPENAAYANGFECTQTSSFSAQLFPWVPWHFQQPSPTPLMQPRPHFQKKNWQIFGGDLSGRHHHFQFLLFNLKKAPQASAKAWLRLCFSCVSSSNCFCKSRSVTCAERKTPKNPRGITSSCAVQSKYEKIINPNYGWRKIWGTQDLFRIFVGPCAGATSGIWQTSPDSAFKLSGFERLSSQVPGLNPVCGHHRHVSESDISTLACIQYPVHWNPRSHVCARFWSSEREKTWEVDGGLRLLFVGIGLGFSPCSLQVFSFGGSFGS